MKRILGMILALSVAGSGAAFVSAAETEAVQWDYMFDIDTNEDDYPFDNLDYQVGNWVSYFAPWKGNDYGGIYQRVTNYKNKGENDKSFFLSNQAVLGYSYSSQNQNFIKRNKLNLATIPDGKLHISFNALSEDTLSTKDFSFVVGSGGVAVYLKPNGIYLKDQLACGFNTGEWYRLDVIADLATGEETLYVNGKASASCTDSYIVNAASVSEYKIQNARVMESDGATDKVITLYMDDIGIKSLSADTTAEEIAARLPEPQTTVTTLFSNDFSGGMQGDVWNSPVGFTYMNKSHAEYYPDTTTQTAGSIGGKDESDLSFVVTTTDLVNRISSYGGGDATWDPFLYQKLSSTVYETTVFSADVYLGDLNSQRWIDLRNNAGEGFNMALIEKDGSIYSSNTLVGKAYPYSWNRFTMIMTPGSQEYTLYLNGKQLGGTLSYYQTFGGDIKDMKLTTMFIGAVTEDGSAFIKPQSGVTAWDNVILYTTDGVPAIEEGPSVIAAADGVVDEGARMIYIPRGASVTAADITATEGAEISFISGAGEEADSAASGDYVRLKKGDIFEYYRLAGDSYAEHTVDWEAKTLTTVIKYYRSLPQTAPVIAAAWGNEGRLNGVAVNGEGVTDEQEKTITYVTSLETLGSETAVKAFVWENTQTLAPVFGTKTISKPAEE